jgi:hypothetical protein
MLVAAETSEDSTIELYDGGSGTAACFLLARTAESLNSTLRVASVCAFIPASLNSYVTRASVPLPGPVMPILSPLSDLIFAISDAPDGATCALADQDVDVIDIYQRADDPPRRRRSS